LGYATIFYPEFEKFIALINEQRGRGRRKIGRRCTLVASITLNYSLLENVDYHWIVLFCVGDEVSLHLSCRSF